MNIRWVFDGRFFVLDGISGFAARTSTRFATDENINLDAYLKQVHSAHIFIIDDPEVVPRGEIEGDGLITALPGISMGVRTADCYPVFLMDTRRRIAGILHAGWRGSHRGIVRRGLDIFFERFGSSPEDMVAAFGPGICGNCYEVGEELMDFFPSTFFHRRNGKLYLDIFDFNRSILREKGIERIVPPPACTYEDERLYSYRRRKDKSRLISTIEILPS